MAGLGNINDFRKVSDIVAVCWVDMVFVRGCPKPLGVELDGEYKTARVDAQNNIGEDGSTTGAEHSRLVFEVDAWTGQHVGLARRSFRRSFRVLPQPCPRARKI